MAQAACLNEDCQRGSWDLRKHPADYAGGVSCPDCGTTRVEIDGDNKQSRDRREPRGGEPRAPARREEPKRARAPARAERQGGVEDFFAVMDSDVPTAQRAKSAKNTLGMLGDFAESVIHYQQQKQEAAERRAEQAELNEVDLPTCPDCDYQFDAHDIGVSDTRVRCPECSALWDIDVPGGE